MRKLIISGVAVLFCASLISGAAMTRGNEKKAGVAMSPIYGFSMKDINGKEVSLGDYKGKVLLLVNVASKCGLTPQYEALQKLYVKYQDKGFVILGFPANNFMGQEPGTNEEIKTFCSTKYNVTFPLFSKISVKGDDIHPLYKFLTDKGTDPEFGGDIKWNFNKFLADRDGKLIARFEPQVKPDSDVVIQAIEKAVQ